MVQTAASRFTQKLESLGIPVDGVSGTDANARIDFKIEATPAQRATALAAARAFDWADQIERTEEEIELDLSNLTQAQRATLINKMLVEFLQRRPRLAEALGVLVSKRI